MFKTFFANIFKKIKINRDAAYTEILEMIFEKAKDIVEKFQICNQFIGLSKILEFFITLLFICFFAIEELCFGIYSKQSWCQSITASRKIQFVLWFIWMLITIISRCM